MSENPFGCAESATSRMKAGSIGRPRQPASGAFENELRIVRLEGGDAGPGEVGELCFRNPVMTAGYWNAPDVTAATIKDGWLRTGDAGFRDDEGDVFLKGRFKEMMRWGPRWRCGNRRWRDCRAPFAWFVTTIGATAARRCLWVPTSFPTSAVTC